MAKVYRNQATLLDMECIFEEVKGESVTIPNQAMSTREILHRFTTGADLNVNVNQPVYLTNVPLYDTRRKHNIDIAVDKHINERNIASKQKEVFDTTTSISELTKSRKQALKNVDNQEPKPTPSKVEE